jgi:dsDNA-binding SOS-regulon protein
MQSKEGNHWHEYHCGWKTKAEAEAAGKLACNAERMKELLECSAVQIYDPEAKPRIEN